MCTTCHRRHSALTVTQTASSSATDSTSTAGAAVLAAAAADDDDDDEEGDDATSQSHSRTVKQRYICVSQFIWHAQLCKIARSMNNHSNMAVTLTCSWHLEKFFTGGCPERLLAVECPGALFGVNYVGGLIFHGSNFPRGIDNGGVSVSGGRITNLYV